MRKKHERETESVNSVNSLDRAESSNQNAESDSALIFSFKSVGQTLKQWLYEPPPHLCDWGELS